jgi:cardiolipin synthase
MEPLPAVGPLVKTRKKYMAHLAEAADGLGLMEMLHLMFGARPFSGSRLKLLTEGGDFYQAQLEAISQAQHTIELESYIFHDDRVGKMYLDALTARACAGVAVRLLLDAAGNWHVAKRFFRPLTLAGGHVFFFRSLSPSRFWWATYRSHRDLLVLDGELAFIGGAGIRDAWLFPNNGRDPWKDCVVQANGSVVSVLQALFRRAWLEQTEELLLLRSRQPETQGGVSGVAIESDPSAGSPTQAYMALQTLCSMVRRELSIITPYFVPPPGLRQMLIDLAASGIRVRMLLPGDNSDHLITRSIARARYGELLKVGVEIYEHLPTMHHGKLFIADGRWTCVGSVNLDYRSLFRNEELFLVADDENFARTAEEHYFAALDQSRRISWKEWCARPFADRLAAPFAALIESHL